MTPADTGSCQPIRILSYNRASPCSRPRSTRQPQKPSWITFFPRKAQRCLSSTVSAYLQANDHPGTHAYAAAGHHGVSHPARHRHSAGLLVGVFAPPLEIPGRSDCLVAIVLPPTVLGFYVLVAVGPFTPLGRWYQALTGHSLAFTFEGLVLGSVLYSLPFAVQPMATSFPAIDGKLLDASALLGASRWRTFWRIVLPLGLPGVLTGLVLSFAHTLGEFGVVLMIGGNIPGATQTVSILIYDQVQALDYATANRTALILLLLCFTMLAILYGLRRRGGWNVWEWR